MADELNYQIKGIKADGRTFHLDAFDHLDEAVNEAALMVEDGTTGKGGDYERLIVVNDERWNRQIGGPSAVGIEWDSARDNAE